MNTKLEIFQPFVQSPDNMNRFKSGVILIVMMATTIVNADTDEVKGYVANLVTSCSLSDGYICNTADEDDFLSMASQDKFIDAKYLQAWNVAYQGFRDLENISIEQKDLKHYKIGFTQSDCEYVIYFSPLLLPAKIVDNQPQGISRISFGQAVKFRIDKEKLTINKFLFYD